MHRTQIYLEDDIYQYLKKESTRTRKSLSDLIRESLRKQVGQKVEKMLRNTDKVCGLWKDQKGDPQAYIRRLRKDRSL